MAAHHFAMALVVTSGTPEFSIEVVWYVFAALIVVALARLGDHLLFAPMS